jgi:hypothetical protein
LQTTLYNNIPYFIKTKLVSAADSNVPGGFVAMDAKTNGHVCAAS